MSVDNQQLVEQFIAYYNTLNEGEKFKLGGLFNKETGGKLSPYNSPTPVSVALIPVQVGEEIKLLGLIRGIAPKIGEIALPGGFLEKLEDPKLAAAREAMEETGLPTNPEDYKVLDLHMAPSNNLLMFYQNQHIYPESIMDTLVLNSEVQGFVLIDRDTPLAFPLHKQMVDQFFDSLENTPTSKVKIKM